MLLFLCVLVLHSEIAHGGTYTVGDEKGWSLFNVTAWPIGKKFHVNDVLVFNYDPTKHNVMKVDHDGYVECIIKPGEKTYQTGHDQIQLEPGVSFFICGFPGHCEGGMRFAVDAFP